MLFVTRSIPLVQSRYVVPITRDGLSCPDSTYPRCFSFSVYQHIMVLAVALGLFVWRSGW